MGDKRSASSVWHALCYSLQRMRLLAEYCSGRGPKRERVSEHSKQQRARKLQCSSCSVRCNRTVAGSAVGFLRRYHGVVTLPRSVIFLPSAHVTLFGVSSRLPPSWRVHGPAGAAGSTITTWTSNQPATQWQIFNDSDSSLTRLQLILRHHGLGQDLQSGGQGGCDVRLGAVEVELTVLLSSLDLLLLPSRLVCEMLHPSYGANSNPLIFGAILLRLRARLG